jgi:V/A-type H+-transporting ATPase subunit A
MAEPAAAARVSAVQEDMVRIELIDPERSRLMKNEVVHVRPRRRLAGHDERLKGEVLRIQGTSADVQVFESTAGVALGDPVELSGEQLSVLLGPGLLGQVYDGLQNPLEAVAARHGQFLPRGVALPGLDLQTKWSFQPLVRSGDRVSGGDVLGTVEEGAFTHRIMVPFALGGTAEILWIQGGSFTVTDPIARISNEAGDRSLALAQSWPVRRPLAEPLLARRTSRRLYPDEPLLTTIRMIDTFFPVARGGTACIPGPFGAGKTVLQNMIARYADVDIVVVVACGERAGEVVETITEFPKLRDPKGGGSLMDRTVIVCNTSAMPVAAREASLYTGITIGEYYRQMGFDVLLIADSTSRWAQAMRETSGRLEEIPGEEAYPAYLDSSIRSVYERAGVVETPAGGGADDRGGPRNGSLTMIGTVSPAGGNFEEPVTQSTLATVKTFLGLSADRAYKRFYPSIDPLLSWSRYRTQLESWYARRIDPGWTTRVEALDDLLRRGDGIARMMQVTGEEGITLDDFTTHQKAVFVDMVYLQQDGFDPVDQSVPLARQVAMFDLVWRVCRAQIALADKEQVREHFTRLTGLFKNLNYAAPGTPDHDRLLGEIRSVADAVGVAAGES